MPFWTGIRPALTYLFAIMGMCASVLLIGLLVTSFGAWPADGDDQKLSAELPPAEIDAAPVAPLPTSRPTTGTGDLSTTPTTAPSSSSPGTSTSPATPVTGTTQASPAP